MAKPPSSGPHSDIDGVHRDYRPGIPNTDPKLGTAESVDEAAKESVGQPGADGAMPDNARIPNAQ